jgi:methionine aminopeptidase
VTTDEIDAKVHDAIVAAGAYPSPLNYFGFPKSICASINEVVIHGIPDDRPLQEGDIAKFDISLFFQARASCGVVARGGVVASTDSYCPCLHSLPPFPPPPLSLSHAHKTKPQNKQTNKQPPQKKQQHQQQGVHGDNCASVPVGVVDPEGLRLVDVAQKALDAGVAACRPGGCLSRVGAAIHDVADAHGYETVRAYSGHGVGPDLHMRPYVLHYR